MKRVLVLNYGSSTLKCSLYEFSSSPKSLIKPKWEGNLSWKNQFDHPVFTVKNSRGEEITSPSKAKNSEEGLNELMATLHQGKTAVIGSLNEIDVVGHRIVHGGSLFTESVMITPQVKQQILTLSELAPLHNPAAVQGISVIEKTLDGVPQVAVFDTAFHHTMPEAAKIYPGPYEWYAEGIQRYGFHGINFRYCYDRCKELLGENFASSKMVVCHLGSGASLCAIQNGKSVDTTMGYTPLEGLMMDTRSGTIDPGILLHLLNSGQPPEGMSDILYHKSGLLGISGVSSDMREVLKARASGDARAKLALEIYLHRLNGFIGAMIASLQGLDIVVFTAGIGENSSFIRERVCSHFSFLGIDLDSHRNEEVSGEDCLISKESSKIKVLVVQAEEAFQIARDCYRFGQS